MKTAVALALALLAACKGDERKAETPTATATTAPDAAPAPTPAAPVPVPPIDAQLTPAWQLDVPLSGFSAAVELSDGRIIAVVTLDEDDGQVTVGKTRMTSRGAGDLVVMTISKDGALVRAQQLGGAGDESLRGLLAAGDHAQLLLDTTGPLTVAGARVPASPKPTIVLVELDATRGPTRAAALLTAANAFNPRMVALGGGDLLVDAEIRTPDDAGPRTGLLQRCGPDGTVRWERTFTDRVAELHGPTGDAAALIEVRGAGGHETAVVALDGDGQELRRLDLRAVNPPAGTDVAVYTEHIIADDSGGLLIFGVALADLEVGGRVLPRLAPEYQAFVVRWSERGAEADALVAGIASVMAVGGGRAVVDVRPPSDRTAQPPSGYYLMTDAADPARCRLVPLSLYQPHPRDQPGVPIASGNLVLSYQAPFLADGGILLIGDRVEPTREPDEFRFTMRLMRFGRFSR